MSDEYTVIIQPPDHVENVIVVQPSSPSTVLPREAVGIKGDPGTTLWEGIENKPDDFPPSAHAHAIADVTDLQTVLNAKADDSSVVKLTGAQTVSDKTLAGTTLTGQTLITGDTLLGSAAASALAISQTWNTTGTPTAFKLDVTDTASNASSLLMDLRVGSNSIFNVAKDGRVRIGGNYRAVETIGSFERRLGDSVICSQLGSHGFTGFNNAGSVGLANGSGGSISVRMSWEGDGVIGLRNGAFAQTFRLYNSYTDGSNYERGFMRWASNVLEIGTEAAGTGTARRLDLMAGGNRGLTVAADGNVGIGTQSPTTKLTVNGNVSVPSGSQFRVNGPTDGNWGFKMNGTNFEFVMGVGVGRYFKLITEGGVTPFAVHNSDGAILANLASSAVGLTLKGRTQYNDAMSSTNNSTTITTTNGWNETLIGLGSRISLSSNPSAIAVVTSRPSGNNGSFTVNAPLGIGSVQGINIYRAIARWDSASNVPLGIIDDRGFLSLNGIEPTAFLDINSNTIRLRTARTPASATATGNQGDICWDENSVYVATATNTWKQSRLAPVGDNSLQSKINAAIAGF